MWPRDPDRFEPAVLRPDNLAEPLAFVFDDAGRLLGQGRPWAPVELDALRWFDIEIHAEHYLGTLGSRPCVAVRATIRALPEGHLLVGLRELLGHVDQELFYLAGRAAQIIRWDLEHRFCGGCGKPTEQVAHERARTCGECGLTCYPRLSPSIIVLIHDGDRCLLARNANWPDGFYSTLAGFVEPGESLEQCLHREVGEEVGIRVRELRYLGSQSWPFPNSLMVGYHATYDGGEIVCQEEEIADARWFARDELDRIRIPPPTAISRWLIDDWLAGH